MSTGLDALVKCDFAPLRGRRVGLVTHPAAIDSRYRSAVELFAENVDLVALFGPEHGITGEAQDLIPVRSPSPLEGEGLGVGGTPRVHSLYGATFDSLKPTAAMLDGLDILVIDLVDVGSRYYTFQATMLYCLEASAAVGLPVMILDRPNPLGLHEVEGPAVQPGFESFVGVHPICTRHGLTMGELATLYKAERVPDVDLTVVRCDADRNPDVLTVHLSQFTVPPSPNMPTATTAEVYPGVCLIEGTNLSEGRGTTRPFEYVGYPGVSPKDVVRRLRAVDLPGVLFLPATFRPTFQKHAGNTCGGCLLVIDDYDLFRPVRTGLAVLIAFRDLLGDAFRWRTERYEFVDHIPAIDLLFGSDRERRAIDAGASWQHIAAAWEPEEAAFRERRKPHLLYRE